MSVIMKAAIRPVFAGFFCLIVVTGSGFVVSGTAHAEDTAITCLPSALDLTDGEDAGGAGKAVGRAYLVNGMRFCF